MTHPTDDHLMAFADGSLSSGMSLLVASHMTFCPACRDRVARLETLGGAFLGEIEAEGVVAPDLASVMARLDEADAAGREAPAADPVLPAPLRAAVGRGSDEIRWRFLLPGISDHKLAGFPGEDVSLLRARPGTRILSHTHEGEEATLVLSGQLKDGGRVYSRGGVSLADASHDHRPEIVGDEVCVCLVVLSGRMRFTGSFGRALNIFTN